MKNYHHIRLLHLSRLIEDFQKYFFIEEWLKDYHPEFYLTPADIYQSENWKRFSNWTMNKELVCYDRKQNKTITYIQFQHLRNKLIYEGEESINDAERIALRLKDYFGKMLDLKRR